MILHSSSPEFKPNERSLSANKQESASNIKLSNTIENPSTPEEPEIYIRARASLFEICQNYDNSIERTSQIIKKVEPFLKHIDKNILPDEKINKILIDLESCSLISDKNEYLDTIMKILVPVLDIRELHTDKFESAQAKAMNESGGFTEINRLLSYGKNYHTIHIHAPAGTAVGNKITLYRDGMKKLAEIINDDSEIKEVTASSHLVASHPGLFSKAGFQIEDVTNEFRNQYFSGEEREIKRATIKREEFLERFLKK